MRLSCWPRSSVSDEVSAAVGVGCAWATPAFAGALVAAGLAAAAGCAVGAAAGAVVGFACATPGGDVGLDAGLPAEQAASARAMMQLANRIARDAKRDIVTLPLRKCSLKRDASAARRVPGLAQPTRPPTCSPVMPAPAALTSRSRAPCRSRWPAAAPHRAQPRRGG